jgi:hypothetical protein
MRARNNIKAAGACFSAAPPCRHGHLSRNAVRLFGPYAVWKDVGDKALFDAPLEDPTDFRGSYSVDEDILRKLEERLGPLHARQRLGIETDHESQVFGQGLIFFHLENFVFCAGDHSKCTEANGPLLACSPECRAHYC